MTVTVTPAEFHFVKFDHAEAVRVVEELLDCLGMAARDVTINIDETTPLGRSEIKGTDPITIAVESGAFENPKVLRTLLADNVANVTGRLLLRVRDRESGAFDDAPADSALALPQLVAWEVYSNGRLGRMGYPMQRQRWLYHFRNRHGFTDAADAAFERLWETDDLSWSEISAIIATAAPVG